VPEAGTGYDPGARPTWCCLVDKELVRIHSAATLEGSLPVSALSLNLMCGVM
jgi:hypothetical protein